MPDQTLDWTAIRHKLQTQQGTPLFWRSLEELAEHPTFQAQVTAEFPPHWLSTATRTDRRTFLKLMRASLVLAGLTGCTPTAPKEQIVPYVVQPEEIVPGKPLFYATAFPYNGYGLGVLVENHMGRPTKVEGNPSHGASLGATNPFVQGSIGWPRTFGV
jgi:molybdopterin-containing oxidoreductase family iron-sulfur binding subunit